jgi:hypothetical protein
MVAPRFIWLLRRRVPLTVETDPGDDIDIWLYQVTILNAQSQLLRRWHAVDHQVLTIESRPDVKPEYDHPT